MTMAFTFEPVRLALEFGDGEAVLAYRDGALVAVLSRLGELHRELAGRWFVEGCFIDIVHHERETFATLSDFEAWAKG